jgi:NitT/TauT family transport system permease protein
VTMGQRLKILALQALFGCTVLLLWEAVGRTSPRMAFALGTPSAVALELGKLIRNEGFQIHLLVTASEAVCGLLIGTLAGTTLGLCLWYSDTVARVVRPFVIGLGTLPVFAFAPLMIIWFGIGFVMKVAMATFATVFFAFSQSYRAAQSVSAEYVEFLRGMGASRRQVLLKAVIPGSIDWVLASMRMNIGFSLLGAFIGEFIASNQGLGFLILRAANLYNIPRAFAAAFGIIALALALDGVGAIIERRRHWLVQLLSVHRELWR